MASKAEKPISSNLRQLGSSDPQGNVNPPIANESWVEEAARQTPSWLVSMVVHMVAMLILALWVLPDPNQQKNNLVASMRQEDVEELEEIIDESFDLEPPIEQDIKPDSVDVNPEVPFSPANDLDAAAQFIELSPFGTEHAPRENLLAKADVGAWTGTGLEGRGSRRGQALKLGATAASEKAVSAALEWLAAHQWPDGGWSFDLDACPSCRGQCTGSGNKREARIAATALGLLPFLGAGHTHKEGKYQRNVHGGLYFLAQQMNKTNKPGSLMEPGGNMYSHGLAAIVLTEAYGMTKDKALHNYAQAALNFICYAQDPSGGGWRYQPQQAGDTSVVGWQIMALKSGHMAYLQVPPITIKKASEFLDAVQANSGANYGYTGPGQGAATTAIGLLCRMYLGWKKDNPALQRGVEWISKHGPSVAEDGGRRGGVNYYYNYYATQVMRHWEGEEWKKWNNVMRDFLVKSQATTGHERGSWHHPGPHNESGGRLYCTAMAAMILEVYYRHMPLYKAQSVEEDFPL
jgi:hypothetical protein